MDLDRIKPKLERWVKSLKSREAKYRLYAWDRHKDGVWVHLIVTPRKGGSEYNRCQVLTKKMIGRLE